jgi:hypothetical protein
LNQASNSPDIRRSPSHDYVDAPNVPPKFVHLGDHIQQYVTYRSEEDLYTFLNRFQYNTKHVHGRVVLVPSNLVEDFCRHNEIEQYQFERWITLSWTAGHLLPIGCFKLINHFESLLPNQQRVPKTTQNLIDEITSFVINQKPQKVSEFFDSLSVEIEHVGNRTSVLIHTNYGESFCRLVGMTRTEVLRWIALSWVCRMLLPVNIFKFILAQESEIVRQAPQNDASQRTQSVSWSGQRRLVYESEDCLSDSSSDIVYPDRSDDECDYVDRSQESDDDIDLDDISEDDWYRP